jgi:hypothetical protein
MIEITIDPRHPVLFEKNANMCSAAALEDRAVG